MRNDRTSVVLSRVGIAVVMMLFVLSAAGCGSTSPSGPHAETQTKLSAARTKWRGQGLNDYTYVFSRSCFCVPEYREPVTITVRGGSIVSVASVANGSAKDASSYRTIDGLFDLIQEAIADEVATIRVEYDGARGYPLSVFIDVDERLADEEIWLEARSLTALR